jgi:hypothetical protein
MTPGPGGQFDHLLKNMKSRVESKESKVETVESRVDTPDTEGKKIEGAKVESRVQKEESRVETIEPVTNNLESRRGTEESRIGPEEHKAYQTGVETIDSRVESLDTKALEEAVEEAIAKPKLGVYSPLAAAMLRYKAITTPRYSMGSEMKTIIERALKETYPELYEEVQKRMSED